MSALILSAEPCTQITRWWELDTTHTVFYTSAASLATSRLAAGITFLSWHTGLWLHNMSVRPSITRQFCVTRSSAIADRSRDTWFGITEYLAKSLKVIRNGTTGKLWYSFLLAFHSNYGRIFSRLWDIQRQRTACPWNMGFGSFNGVGTRC